MTVHRLDVLGETCPVPLWRTKEKLKTLQPGDKLVVLTDFPRAVMNIMELADNIGYPFEVTETDNGVWRLELTCPHPKLEN